MENYKKEEIFELVKNVIISYSNEIDKKINDVNYGTRLIGSTSQLDSSDLVQIIVEVEDLINLKFGTDLTLTDEKAMSRTTSPFINIETFVSFINEKLNEK
jgi:acyl carrier protein